MNINMDNLPQHIAIIMDGNGRWAKKHAMGRIRGHRKGAQAVRTVVRTCREIGIKY
ncbi:MAG: undecaprenyl diphosphate synthase family protein, partial [Smithella sp.]